MRNLFDQYSQPENRITHALMTALDKDRGLLESFLRELVRVKLPTRARNLAILEQQYPWIDEPPESELERRGIPDGSIYNADHEWRAIIESKVLRRHRPEPIIRTTLDKASSAGKFGPGAASSTKLAEEKSGLLSAASVYLGQKCTRCLKD